MIWVKIASLLMFLGVVFGAFGAHALKSHFTEYQMDVFKTAVFYHFVHALGLFVIAWLSTVSHDPKVSTAGIFMLAGILLFCGSLYLIAFTGQKWLGAITPLGGLSFLISWLLVLLIR